MTQQEFTLRTNVKVNDDEFDAINTVYMNSDIDKDAFCKIWKKMNASRVVAALEEKRANEEDFNFKSDLFAIKMKMREFDFNDVAITHLTADEFGTLGKANVNVHYNKWGGVITCGDIVFDLVNTSMPYKLSRLRWVA